MKVQYYIYVITELEKSGINDTKMKKITMIRRKVKTSRDFTLYG